MATNRRDVSLVIRAKDEAAKAFESAAQALQNLLSVNNAVGASATKTGDRLGELAALALTLDKAYAKISGSADNAAAAFARQQASINESKSQLAALEGQASAAAAAIARLKSADAIVDAGRDQSGRIAQLQFLTEQYERLQGQQNKLRTSIVAQEAALDGQRNSLQQIGSTALAAEAAQERLRVQIEKETRALQIQTAAAEKNARVLATIERATGVTRDRTDLDGLNQQIQAEQALIDKLKAEQAAQLELLQIEEARKRAATLLPGSANSGKSARDSAAVFMEEDRRAAQALEGQLKETAAAERQMADATDRLRSSINPMAAIQDRLNQELIEAERLFKAGRISAREYDAAVSLLKNNAKQAGEAINNGKPALFGLTPYAVTNLGYQINDVVTQLASGTSLAQTLAQQGGQIIQIFPRAGAAIIAAFSNPVILATVAAVGALVLGIREAADQAARLREFEGALTASGTAAAYQATELAEVAEALDRYGLSAKEAISVVRTFVKEGINPDLLIEFGQAARDMADALGVDVPDAAKQLAAAFTGGYDAIKRLQDVTGAYTEDELVLIRTLFEEGRAHEARARAFDIYSRRMDEGAAKARGPWTEAMRSVDTVWQSFLDNLAHLAPIRGAIHALNQLAAAVSGVGDAASNGARIDEINREVARLQQGIDRLNAPTANTTDWFRDNQIKGATAEIQRLVAEREKLVEQNKRLAATDPLGDGGAAAIRRNERLAEIALEERRANLEKLTGEQRVAEAGQLAFEKEMLESGDQVLAQAERNLAVAREREKVERDTVRQIREQRQEQERQRREWSADIADNGRESLVSTAQRFSGMNETSNRGDLMSFFRQNGIDVDPKMTAWCAAFVNAVLGTNGLPGTGSLMARSFLNYGQDATNNPQNGDIVVLRRGDNAAQGHVGFFQGYDERGNVRVLGGNQRDGVNTQSFGRDDVLGIRRAPSTGQVATQQARDLDQLLQRQQQFNEALDRQIETRQQDTNQLRDQLGLTGEALIAKQREQAIDDAILKARQDAGKAGVDTESAGFKQRLELIRQTEGAYFDLSKARDIANARRDGAETSVDELSAQRDALMERIRFYEEQGNSAGADQVRAQLDTVNTALDEAITKALAFWEAMAGSPEQMAALGLTAQQIDTIKLKLEASRPAAENLGRQFLMTGQQINQSFAQSAVSAFDRLAQAVAQGQNVLSSLRDAFLQFAADFLRQIAQMIIQQAIFNAIGGSTAGGSGGFGGFISGLFGGMFHEGGVVGEGGTPRLVDPSWFNSALRYHTGGVVGLRPNEMPAVLERGEEVLTADDPRHVNNGGAGGGATNIRNVVVFDPAEALKAALGTKVGEKAFFTFVRENKGAFQAAVG